MPFNNHEITIIISLFSLGLFGGFSHCIGMCGPFVLTQVNNRLENIKIAELNHLAKLKGIALLPYHLGRITTYSFIGGASSLLLSNIKNITQFKIISALLLIIASIIFISTIFDNTKLRISSKIRLPFKINLLKNCAPVMSNLFSKPYYFKGYILGILLGFIPCGLLYGAIAVAASIDNFLIAALAMFCFGIATIPSLFLTAMGSYLFLNKIKKKIKFFAKTILLINAMVLFIMAIDLLLN